MFYTVPSRLIGHRLGGRVYDDRIELFLSGTPSADPAGAGRAGAAGPSVQVVNYHHVIHSLKKKPMALLNLVYRDELFPRAAYRRCFERALERAPGAPGLPPCRWPCWRWRTRRTARPNWPRPIDRALQAGRLPDPGELKARIAPPCGTMPGVDVATPPLGGYGSPAARGRCSMTDPTGPTAPDPNQVDAMKLSLMLTDLRLPTIGQLWQDFATRADQEGWTAARFLAALAEHELARPAAEGGSNANLREARLLPGKTLHSFDFNVVPMISKAQVNALAVGDAWLTQGANLPRLRSARRRQESSRLRHRPRPGRERIPRAVHADHRSGAAPAGGQARTRAGKPAGPGSTRFHLLILDDLAYVRKDPGRDRRALRTHLRTLRAAIAADHRQSALRGMAQGVSGRNHGGGGRRSPRPPRPPSSR